MNDTPFRDLFRSRTVGVICTDLNGRIWDANQAFLDLLGYSIEDLQSGRLNWRELTPPEFMSPSTQAVADQIGQSGVYTPLEKEYFHKDGSRVPVLVSITRLMTGSDRFVTFVADLSLREEMRQALSASEERFQQLFEHAPLSLQIFRADGICIAANKSWEKLWGISRDSIVAAKYNLLKDEQLVRKGLMPYIERGFAGESTTLPIAAYDPVESRLIGTARWLAAYIYPIKTVAGQTAEVVLILEDVTDTHEAVEALRASEERFRFLSETIPHIVFTTAASGTIDYCNQRMFTCSGRTFADIRQGGLASLFHPGDRAEIEAVIMQAQQRGHAFEVAARMHMRATSQFRWALVRAEPYKDESGQILKWFGTVTDIHQQKRLQELQSFLSEASGIVGSSLDYQTTLSQLIQIAVPRIADWCAVHILEKSTLKPIATNHVQTDLTSVSWNMLNAYPPLFEERTTALAVHRSIKTRFIPRMSPEDYPQITQDPQQLTYLHKLGFRSYVCVPMRAMGEVVGRLSFARCHSTDPYTEEDVETMEELASRAALAVENARLYREAQIANRMKDEFLAILSHELRTPLTVILAHSDLLSRKEEALGDLYPAVASIYRNARTQTQIVNDLLDVSAIITGKMRFQPSIVSPAQIASAAIDSLRFAADAKQLTIATDLSQAPGSLSADPLRLQQIIWNLFSNAVKFTSTGGHIRVCVREKGSCCEIIVSDTGKGIDESFLPYAFDRFRQEENSRTRTHGGLGLGLAIVRHLVELHGGRVKAESEGRDKGSRFTVTLPLRLNERGTPAAPAIPLHLVTSSDATESTRLMGSKVLVVEDETDTREILARLLSRVGATVIEADSAAEGYRHYLLEAPDLIVCDVSMPGEDGYDFIRRLRTEEIRTGRFTPTAAFTAHVSEEDRNRILAAGFQAYLTKPIDMSFLLSELARLLGPRAAAR